MVLKNLMHKFRGVSLFLSLASIGLEAVAVVAIFLPVTRPLILASAAGMHLGIWLTMWPNYFPQTLCYALGVAWMEASAPSAQFNAATNPALVLASWAGVSLWLFLGMVALLRIEWWPLTGIPMYSFYRDSTYSYKHLRDASQAQQVALEHQASGYPNAIAWSNLWITLRLKNTDPALKEERRARKADASSSSSSPTSLSPESPMDSYVSDASKAFADAARLSSGASPSAAAAAAADRKSAESSGLHSSEREFVNLKSRVTDAAYTRGGASGAYVKQWRRTLHNVAAADMASKPLGHIEACTTSAGRPGPALIWLQKQLPHLRAYARDNAWNLPEWVDATGELQLRVKLKDRYAILARLPWNPATPAAATSSASASSLLSKTVSNSAASAAGAPSRVSRKNAAPAAAAAARTIDADNENEEPTTPKQSTQARRSPRTGSAKKQ